MMEITCPSCSTVYNVAAEQLTGKGVNFRCSQCEFVFKVRKNAKDPTGPIQVQRVSVGDVLAYDEMADVQRDIVEGKLSRRDQLSERGGAWRELGQFQNLAPFFSVVERSAQLGRKVENTQDQPAVSTSTRAFSPVKPWDDEAPAEVPPRTNISDSAFAGKNARSQRSGTATFSPLTEDVLSEEPPPAPKNREVVEQPSTPPRAIAPVQPSFEQDDFDRNPAGVYSDDGIDEYENRLRKRRGGAIFVVLLILVMVGTAAAVLFRDEIGGTDFGSKLPYFSQAGQTDSQLNASQTTAAATAPTDNLDASGDGNSQAAAAAAQDAQSDVSADGTDAGLAGVIGELDAETDIAPETRTDPESDRAESGNEEIEREQDPAIESGDEAAAAPREVADNQDRTPPSASNEPPAPSESARPPAQNTEEEAEPETVNIQEMSADRATRHGRRALSRGDARTAVEAFERAAGLEPNSFDTQVKLGQAYQAAGDNVGAHRAYSNALRANPRYMPAIFGIADVERTTGRRDAAIERYQTILRISPSGDRAEQAKNALRGLGVSVD